MASSNGTIDELDTKIIQALQEDARTPYKTIAKDLDVSEGTISNRVNRMTKNGILKLEARVNPFAMDNKVAALLGINLKHRTHAQAIKKIKALPGVTAVWVTSGKYDIFVELMADSINALNDFLFDHGFNHIEEIEVTETHIMLHSDTKFFKLG